MKNAGYSGTPLEKKLGLKNNFKIRLINPPIYYFTLFKKPPTGIKIIRNKAAKKDFIHYFTKNASQFKKDIPHLKNEILPNGAIWVSWPKKTSKIPTDLDENNIRKIALQNGLVDVKVCAVDNTWSGLKLVIPVKDRK